MNEGGPCAFAKAVMAGAACCEQAHRRTQGEHSALVCGSAVAHINCDTLLGMMTERARFALKMGVRAQEITHQQALRVQCGGLQALAHALQAPVPPDVHQLVLRAHAQQRFADLPWPAVVAGITRWQLRRRYTPEPPR